MTLIRQVRRNVLQKREREFILEGKSGTQKRFGLMNLVSITVSQSDFLLS